MRTLEILVFICGFTVVRELGMILMYVHLLVVHNREREKERDP